MPGSASAGWRAGTVAVTGGELAYHRTGGEGPVLVLSHGLTDSGLCWSRFAQALAPDFDIIMLDARGHGLSTRIGERRLQSPGEDIGEAVEGLGLVRPIVMGHSVGARATAEYAAAYPDFVSKVILEDPPLLPPSTEAEAVRRRGRFARQVEQYRAMTDAQITAAGKAASPTWHDDEFPAWTMSKRQVDPDAMPSYPVPWQQTIAAIAAPTLLILGDSGGLVTQEIADEACALNGNITSVLIPGAGHNVRRENLAAVLAAVRSFLG